MSVHTTDIYETLLFGETLRKNLNTCNVFESINFVEKPRTQHKFFNIKETISFAEALKRQGGIKNLNIAETLHFTQLSFPRAYDKNVGDVLWVKEELYHYVIFDQIGLIETLTLDITKNLYETLELTEVLTLNLSGNLAILETLDLQEGVIGFKV